MPRLLRNATLNGWSLEHGLLHISYTNPLAFCNIRLATFVQSLLFPLTTTAIVLVPFPEIGQLCFCLLPISGGAEFRLQRGMRRWALVRVRRVPVLPERVLDGGYAPMPTS